MADGKPSLRFGYLALALISMLAACAVPVPVPTKTSAPPSLERTDGKIDLTFLQPSVTTKADVVAKLGWSDTLAGPKDSFIGRWSTSSSKTYWFVGGPGGADAGEFRNWTTRTIIIEFNDQEVVQSWHLVADKELVHSLRQLAQRRPDPERFDTPVELHLKHRHNVGDKSVPVTVVLTKQSLHFVGYGDEDFEVPPNQIKALSIPKILKSDQERPDPIGFTVHLSTRTKAGNQITFLGSAADLMALIEYQVQSSK